MFRVLNSSGNFLKEATVKGKLWLGVMGTNEKEKNPLPAKKELKGNDWSANTLTHTKKNF